MFSTATTRCGSAQSRQYFAMVTRPALPSLCIAPTPAYAINNFHSKMVGDIKRLVSREQLINAFVRLPKG